MTASLIDAGRLDAVAPSWNPRRPLRIALLGHFGATPASRAADTAAMSARRPRRIDFDTFDDAIAHADLTLDVALPDGRIAGLRIAALDDLHPDELLRQLPRGSATPDALRAVLMHPELRRLESAWRGVDLVVRELGPGAALEIHVFDLTAAEMAADLDAGDDLSRSALYAWLVGRPSEDADGGYGAVACLHDNDATPTDLGRLARLARIAAQAGAPLFTAMSTDTLADRRHPPEKAVRAAFDALRARPEAGFLCLAGPRFQLRHAYGRATDRIGAFDFEEFDPRLGLRSMCWGHPALVALLAWHRGGDLMLRDRPLHVVRDADGDQVALPCTDRLIRADMAVTLREYGVQALMAARNEPALRVLGLAAVDGTALSRNGPKPVVKAMPAEAMDEARTSAAIDDVLESRPDRSPAPPAAAGPSDAMPPASSGTTRSDSDSDSAASEDAMDAMDAMDAELAALLKSLE
ncbi:type VI secretion system contractile sheath domain-containing protein [Roseateles noduli]|uniref:type VI secretion system contractile sheath domain-containing protein n=1 Tax=Roseateles noduli TaxID=2052484 RepID=UPI003D65B5BA